MRCTNCGSELPDRAKYCRACGMSTTITPVHTSEYSPEPSSHGNVYRHGAASNDRDAYMQPTKKRQRKRKGKLPVRSILTALCAVLLVVAVILVIPLVRSLLDSTSAIENPKNETEESQNQEGQQEETPVINVPVEKEVELVQGADGAYYLVFFIEGQEYRMVIANKTYALPQEFGRNLGGPGGLDPEAYDAYDRMDIAANESGFDLQIVSGYRSYESQVSVFAGWVAEYGSEEEANKVSARPGESEHQTGLTMDLNSLSFSFSATGTYGWLFENAADYGFIERYPDGKEEVTGYKYEPWHYRYVGIELARYIKDSGLCVEDFVAKALLSA